MKVLVTGATGFVGGSVIRRFSDENTFEVVAAVRNGQKQHLIETPVVEVGDMSAETDWTTALSEIDAVVHTAARVHVMKERACDPLLEFRRINVAGTLRLAKQAADNGVKRFIYISSVKVNGEATSVGEPFSVNSKSHPQDFYGISKLESEQELEQVSMQTGMELVILRPPLVYGPGVGANFLRLVKAVHRGVPLPFASICNKRSLISIGNLVDAIYVSLIHSKAAGKTYLLSDNEDISTPELVIRIASALQCSAKLIPFPPSLIKMGARIIGKGSEIDRLVGSLEVDISQIQQDLSWSPPYSVNQGLELVADWYLAHHVDK